MSWKTKKAPLTYNGVVYNERKGALSSPEVIMEDRATERLFPDNTYGVGVRRDPGSHPDALFPGIY